jgi:tetratricopeptide (TPR) repeat protein
MAKSGSKETGTSAQAGAKILSRFQAVDDLLLRRPSADPLASGSSARQPTEPTQPRVELQRYQELEQAIRHTPADPMPYLELAEIYFEQQRWRDALRVLDSGVANQPDHDGLLSLHEEARHQVAKGELMAAQLQAKEHPTEENVQHAVRAEVSYANTRISVCASRLERHPEQTELLLPLASAHCQLGQMEEAFQRLQQAEKIAELRGNARFQLGRILQQRGDYLDALSAYRRAAIARNPLSPHDVRCKALDAAAQLAESQGWVEPALGYLKIWKELAPESSQAIQTRIDRLELSPR